MTIDQRVVEMRFDNANFEHNVSSSISALDKLKAALNFSGATKGFDDINDSIKGVQLSSISEGVEKVSASFSALEVMAISVLKNITDRAVDAGLKLVESLSVDQISAGWNKFQEKTESVATMLYQGYSMDEVDAALEKLNWFTDETSYKFSDMVDNISKFTAQGVDLDDAVKAMEGVGLATSMAGQDVEKASSAMYMLSRAMANQAMTNYTWRLGFVNTNIATMELKQTILDTAVAMGKLKDKGDGVYETLSGKQFTIGNIEDRMTEDKWFDSDVITAVFGKYASAVDDIYAYTQENEDAIAIDAIRAFEAAGDAVDSFGLTAFKAGQETRTLQQAIDAVKDATSTGFMSIFEQIFGNYEEAKSLWSDLVEELWTVFVDPIQNTSELLKEWKELGGRDDFLEAFWTAWHSIGEVIGAVKEGFRRMFPETTAESIKKFTENLVLLAQKLIPTEEKLNNITQITVMLIRVFRNLWRTVKTVFGIIKDSVGIVSDQFEVVFGKSFIDVIKDVLQYFGILTEKILNFVKMVRSGGVREISGDMWDFKSDFATIIKAIWSGISLVWNVIKSVWKGLSPLFKSLKGTAEPALHGIADVLVKIANWLIDLNEQAEKSGVFAEITEKVAKSVEWVVNAVKKAVEWIKNLIDACKKGNLKEFFEGIGEAISSWPIVKFFKSLRNNVGTVFNTVYGYIRGFLKKIGLVKESTEGAFSFSSVKDKVLGFFQSIAEKLKKAKDAVVEFVKNNQWLITVLKVLGGIIVAPFYIAYKVISWLVQKVSELIDKAGGLSGVFEKIKQKWELFKKNVGEKLKLPSIDTLIVGVAKFIKVVKEDFAAPGLERLSGVFEKIADRLHVLKDWFDRTVKAFKESKFFQFLKTLWKEIKDIASAIWEWLEGIFGDWNKKLEEHQEGGGAKNLLSFLAGAGLVEGINAIKNLILGFKAEKLLTIADSVKKAIDGVTGTFESMQKKLHADALKSIATALLIMAASMAVLALIPSDDLTKALLALSGLAGVMVATMSILSLIMDKMTTGMKLDKSGFSSQSNNLAAVITAFGTAMLMMAIGMKIIEKVDPGVMWSFAGAISIIMVAMGVAMKLMEKTGKDSAKAMKSVSDFMKSIGLVIVVLAWSVHKLSKIENLDEPVNALLKLMGVIGLIVGVVTMIVMGAAASMNDAQVSKVSSIFGSLSLMLIIIAAAMLALVPAIKALSDLGNEGNDISEATLGIAAIIASFGVLFVLIASAAKIAQNSTSAILALSVPILAMGGFIAAAALLADVLSDVSKDQLEAMWPVLATIFGGMAVMFVAILVASKLAKNSATAILAMSTPLLAVATIIAALSLLVKDLVVMPVDKVDGVVKTLLVVMGGIAVITGILVGAAAVLGSFPAATLGLLAFGAVIATVAVSVMIFVEAIKVLTTLDVSTLMDTVLTIAKASAVLVAISAVAGLAAPLMLILAGTFLALGLGVAALSLGLDTFIGTLLIVAANAELVSTGLTILIDSVVMKVIEAIPMIVLAIINGLVQIIVGIEAQTPVILEKILSIGTQVIGVVFQLIITFLTLLADNIEVIANKLVDIVLGIINVIASRAQDIVNAIWNLVSSIFKAVWSLILGWFGVTWDEAVEWVEQAWKDICQFFADIFAWIDRNIVQPIRDIIDWIVQAWQDTCEFFAGVFAWFNENIIQPIAKVVTWIYENIISPIIGFVDMIIGYVSEFVKWINGIFSNVKQWLWDHIVGPIVGKYEEMKDAAGNLISGLWNGISEKWKKIKEKIKGVWDGLLKGVKDFFKIASPSKVFDSVGTYLMDGLANGISEGSLTVLDAAENGSKGIVKTYQSARDDLDGIFAEDFVGVYDPFSDLNENLEEEPITPVVDTSNVDDFFKDFGLQFDGLNNSSVLTPSIDLGTDALNSFNSSAYSSGTASSFAGDLNTSSSGAAGSNYSSGLNTSSNSNNNGTNSTWGNGNTFTFNNTFNVTGDDPEVIADAVARIIQERIERKEAVWA